MDKEIYQQMRRVEDEHWWFAGRRQIVRHVLSTLPLPATTRVLDVGCGTGGNLPLLTQFGSVIGVEQDDDAIVMARKRGAAEVVKGSLPDRMPFAAAEFDLIVATDVIEHINDDAAALATLNRLLAAKGHLLLTVPAFPILWGAHDDAHHHKRRYVSATLRTVVENAGLNVRRLTYYNTWLFPVAASARLLGRVLPAGNPGRGIEMPSRMINYMLRAIFSSERHLLQNHRMPFGLSLLAIAQKSAAAGK